MLANYSNLAEVLLSVVEGSPDRTAIKDKNNSFTYRQLYVLALHIARKLLAYGIKPGDRVACVSKKDTDSLLCFWGIILCDAVPVMLDHEDGIKINTEKIKEVRVKAIILDREGQTAPVETQVEWILDFKDMITSPDSGHHDRPVCTASTGDVCYILLTSGTTGKSKAVQISHGNVLHYAWSVYDKLGRPEKVNAVHASTFAADLGLTNLLVALVSGGMLRILDKIEATDPAIFHDIIQQDRISLVKITPSHLLALISGMKYNYKKPVDTIVLGGEKLSWETVKTIVNAGICVNLFNHYGPTEATIGAIAFKIDSHSVHFERTGSVPMGTPLGKNSCFLDSPSGGDTGELYITGPGVSIGYFENETENNKKFFIREIEGLQTCCYRTGDICRKLDDGNYEFLYRTDRQVKVKGYRIELGEIELAISAHPDIETAIVCLSDNPDHPVIEAYIKIPKDRQPEMNMKGWLSDKLPGYKIPSHFYFYTRAPYNSNGKIDMNALKSSFAQKEKTGVEEFGDPATASWPELAGTTWRKILNRNDITGSDDFFGIGGDSLMAIQLIGRLQRYGYKVHVTDLNHNSQFDEFLKLMPEKKVEQPLSQFNGELHKMTFSQQDFLRQEGADPDRYCQAVLLETADRIRIREMTLAFHNVVESHAELTRSFRKPFHSQQLLHSPLADRFQFSDRHIGVSVMNGRSPVSIQIQDIYSRLLKKISAEDGPLFILHLCIDDHGKDYCCLICHHLVIDVISWNIVIDELLDNYERLVNNEPFQGTPENTVREFFHALFHKTADKGMRVRPYEEKIVGLPAPDVSRPAARSLAVSQTVIPKEISDVLQQLSGHEPSSTLNGYLLSAFGNAILQALAIPEITIDMEFHGRPQREDLPDLSRSVAWWATTWPVHFGRGKLDPFTCTHLIREATVTANKMNVSPEQFPAISRSGADVRFNYLGRFPESWENGVIKLSPSCFNPGSTRGEMAFAEYKLYFTARYIGETLIIDVQYQLSAFSQERIGHIMNLFFNYLKDSVSTKDNTFDKVRMPILESYMPSVGQPLYNIKVRLGKSFERRSLFLTGATGFLGGYLASLCSNEEGTDVYCLVRGKSQDHAEYRLKTNLEHYFPEWPEEKKSRIHAVRGELLADKFGMTEENYERIAKDTGLILHAAADINLMKDYRELERINVGSLRKMIELAATGMDKEIHYISTLAVSGYVAGNDDRDFSEDDFDYGQTFISDYERTKFEGEKLMRHFLRSGGKGKIYRVGHIAADSLYGRFQHNIEQNRIFQIIKGLILLKKIPGAFQESLSFSHVDIVAAGIVHCCLGRTEDPSVCLHIENPHTISFTRVADLLRQFGYELEVVDLYTFKEAVGRFEGSDANKTAVHLAAGWVQRSMDYPRRVNYIHRRSLDTIAEAGLYFPGTNFEWFSCMLREGIKAGYFQSPVRQDDVRMVKEDVVL